MSFWKDIDSVNTALDPARATTVLLLSDNDFGSAIRVQAHQRINIGIVIGDKISDLFSATTFSAATSAMTSTMSAVITLQRRMREETLAVQWRDVQTWSVTIAQGSGASSEDISVTPEPETCEYRIGIKTGDFQSGLALARIGTA